MSNLFSDPLGSTDSFGGAAGVELAPIGVSVPSGYPGSDTFGGGNGTMGLEPLPTGPDLSHLPLATVDADEMARTQLAMQLGTHAVPFPSIEALATKLNGTPLVVVLGPSMASPDQLAVVERLTRPPARGRRHPHRRARHHRGPPAGPAGRRPRRARRSRTCPSWP